MFVGDLLIKGSESKNIRVSSFAGNLRMKIVPAMRNVAATAEKFAGIDSIGDFPSFEREILPLVHTKVSMQASFYGSESYKYGYYNEMLKYSGCKFSKFSLLPGTEHGVRFGQAKWKYNGANIAYACHSDNRVNEIREADDCMPVFVVGPYIHYAEPYYSKAREEELKKKLGRTLLVVLSHSYEGDSTRNAAGNCVETIYERYGADFDTVMVCVYWNDMKEPEVEQFRERGAFLVSAGFREDPNFVRRLKTIISLSDYVVGNDIGTNLGYCMSMGKQFALVCSGNRIPSDEYYTQVYGEFEEAFTPLDGKYEFSKEQKEQQKNLLRRWWGIGEFEKTPEEMLSILTLVQKICKCCGYNTDNRDRAVKELLAGDKLSDAERRELLKALGQ